MPIEHVKSAGIENQAKARLVRLGKLRGEKTLDGGYALEIVSDSGDVRRVQMTPRETVIVAINLLASQGLFLDKSIDPNSFRHTNG